MSNLPWGPDDPHAVSAVFAFLILLCTDHVFALTNGCLGQWGLQRRQAQEDRFEVVPFCIPTGYWAA